MRLTLSTLLCAALLASPALAHDGHDRGHFGDGPPPGADMPPPPPGYGPYSAPMDPRWGEDQARMHHEWMERCGRHHGHDDRDDREGPGPDGCGQPGPYGYGYPGAYMGYAVPMIMVPVMRAKPCRETVEEWVEEVVPARRRVIRPRAHVVPDKRVRVYDKRVPMTPTKRIPY